MAERQPPPKKQAKATKAQKPSAKRAAPATKSGPKASRPHAGPSPAEEHQRISERAYYLFLERGCGGGLELEDWLRAEALERGRSRA